MRFFDEGILYFTWLLTALNFIALHKKK